MTFEEFVQGIQTYRATDYPWTRAEGVYYGTFCCQAYIKGKKNNKDPSLYRPYFQDLEHTLACHAISEEDRDLVLMYELPAMESTLQALVSAKRARHV